MPDSQQDYQQSDPPRVPESRNSRWTSRPASRAGEVEVALAAVEDGRGAFVWAAEEGMGASATLELICEAVHQVRVPRAPVVVRCQASAAPELLGGAVASVVSQVVQLTGRPVPGTLSRALDVTSPEYGYLPEVGAVALAEYLQEAADGATVVLVADDFHLVDERSRAIVVSLVTHRRAPVVLLATATLDGFDRALPHPVETRAVPPLGPADALRLLLVECRLAVAPHVAARLADLLGGNTAAIVQTARLLTAEQLSGGAILPDPLPAVPAVRALLGARLDALPDTQRRALLVAAIAVVDRTDALLEATQLDMDDLLDGPLAEHLDFVSGRFSFVDPRMRALVHGEARLADRTLAHSLLARAHTALGEHDLATWHTALATLAGDPALAPGLLALARRLLEHGDVVWAHEAAREAASQGVGRDRVEAYALAGVAALQSGHVHDAADWLRKAARSGDEEVRARILGPLVNALTFVEGQVPDDVVMSHVARYTGDGEGAAGGEASEGRAGGRADGRVLDVLRGATTAACLHAERGDGIAAVQMLAAAARLVEVDPRGVDELTHARAWAAVFGVGERPEQCPTGTATDPATEAYAQVCKAFALAGDDACDLAAQTLASAVASLAPVQPPGRWFDGSEAAVTPLVEAHLRLTQVLVHFWAGDLRKATRDLAEAAYRLPVGLPFAGVGVAVARRLDMVTTGSIGTLATALEETCVCPTSQPVRLGLLVDRAIGAAFANHHTQAATLLELAAERERTDCARLVHIPGLDDVEAWVLAGRPDAARRALARRRVEAKDLSPATRAAVLARGEIALAGLEELEAHRAAALGVRQGLLSPFEHARTELCAGRALARLGDFVGAQGHLLSAVELFGQSGSQAWLTLAQDELAGVDTHLGATTAHHRPPATAGASAAAAAARSAGIVLGEAPGATTDGGQRPGATEPQRLAARESDVSDAALGDLRARWADELTERELDVALLVVQGGANREVAEQLYLSVRTVEVHLGRVFRKLGVRSRVELAVLAHRTGR